MATECTQNDIFIQNAGLSIFKVVTTTSCNTAWLSDTYRNGVINSEYENKSKSEWI